MELQLKNLTKKYKEKVAVNHVNTTFTPGIYGLLGANGAGKSTLMRMICDVLAPTEGEITVNGNRIVSMGEEYRRMLGYLPQNFGYYPDYSALEFMRYIAALKGIPRLSANRQVRQLMELVSLSDVANNKIKTYSGGMKQRLGIAQTLLGNPKILILDEPTAGLDPKERVRFRNIIAEFAKEKIVILSTHIVSDIEYISDYTLLMKNGRLILTGKTQDLALSLEGKVWKIQIPEKQLEQVNDRYTVVNIHREEAGMIDVRVVSDEKPSVDAIMKKATLEDLYLFHFRENMLSGKAAVLYRKEIYIHTLSGVLTEERVTQDINEYQKIFSDLNNLTSMRGGEMALKDDVYYKYFEPRRSYLNMIGNAYSNNELGSSNLLNVSLDNGAQFYEARNKTIVERISDNEDLNKLEKNYWIQKALAVDTPFEYGYALGWSNFGSASEMLIVCIIGICIAIAPVFAEEYRTGTASIILSTRYGKNKVITAKIISALVV